MTVKRQNKKKMWPAVLIAIVGCVATVILGAREEEKHLPKTLNQALAVETVLVQKINYRVRIPGWGFVEPRETIDIRAEISGKITDVPAGVFSGAAIKQGALLFAIDGRRLISLLSWAREAYRSPGGRSTEQDGTQT